MKIRFDGELQNNLLITEVITDVDADRAFKLFSNKVMMIRGLYSDQENAEGNCPKGLEINPTPIENKIQTSIMFNLKATERLVLGVCGDDLNLLRTQILMLYCKNQKTFYDLRYFYPKSQKPIEMPVASCAN